MDYRVRPCIYPSKAVASSLAIHAKIVNYGGNRNQPKESGNVGYLYPSGTGHPRARFVHPNGDASPASPVPDNNLGSLEDHRVTPLLNDWSKSNIRSNTGRRRKRSNQRRIGQRDTNTQEG